MLRFYILDRPIDLIIGKKATIKYHILDMFHIHFWLETSRKIPLCTEFKSYGEHSQCTNCSTPHNSIHEQPLNKLVPMDIDNTVSTTNLLAQHISQSVLSSYLNHDIPSPSFDIDSVLSNRITENILSSSVPEQWALRAIAKGDILERLRQSNDLRQPKGSNSTKQGILATLGVSKPKTRGCAGLGPVVLTASETRCKDELLTNLGEDDDDDFMEDLNIESFEPFQYKPETVCALNDESNFQSWPLSNTSHIGTKIAKFFGIIDLTQGFHHISLTFDAIYTQRPFGMKGGPSWFQQHLARTVLKDYLYDICELYAHR